MTDRPLLLLTNDDGFEAKGIRALADAARAWADVITVAPDRDQSAVSHMISLHRPVRAHRVDASTWAIEGTPADCVYLALHRLLDRKPDLILSGINMGANLGTDVHYSGTVSAAIEGTLMGLSAIAFSAVRPKVCDFEHVGQFGSSLARSVHECGGLSRGTTLNVNFPEQSATSFQYTFLGHRPYDHSVHERVDPRGRSYFWIGGDPVDWDDAPGSDSHAVRRGCISVSPLTVDMTDQRAFGGRWTTKGPKPSAEGFTETSAQAAPEGWWLGESL